MKYFISIFLILGSSLYCQDKRPFTDSFMIDNCTFSSRVWNTYFILQPGYQLVFEGVEDEDTTQFVIRVLNEIKIETRVVEENESENGKTIEISRNFYSYCEETGSIFYFGEEIDIYKEGKIVSHRVAWIAEGNNKPE